MDATTPADRPLTVQAVRDRLGFKRDEPVLALIRAGALRAANVGTGTKRPTWRVQPADLDRFLASRAAVPATPAPGPSARRRPMRGVTAYY